MLQSLPIAFAQVKAGNNSEFIKWLSYQMIKFIKLLNEIFCINQKELLKKYATA